MKLKFLFCAAAAFLSAGCNDEDGSGDFGNLKFPDTGELDQTFKADQTSSRLTFEVAEAWTSEVVYGDSRADETTGWVSLSPDHGGAGRESPTQPPRSTPPPLRKSACYSSDRP
jgi:hypothetical protein